MKTSKLGIDLIKEFESFSPVPYICSAGKVTIGFGHRISSEENFPDFITREQGEDLLRKDLEPIEWCVEKYTKVPLNQFEWDALVVLTFNIGIFAFKGSTLRWKLNQGLRKEAAEEFLRWNKFADPADGKLKVSNGLDRRRKKERELFLRRT